MGKALRLMDSRRKALVKRCVPFTIAVALMLSVIVLYANSLIAKASTLNTMNPDTWSVDFKYNGYFSGYNGTTYLTNKNIYWGSCTEIGSAITKVYLTNSQRTNGLYYELPYSRDENAYFKFSKAFVYTDPDTGDTEYYDVKMYCWSPTTLSDTQDCIVIAACNESTYNNSYFQVSAREWANGVQYGAENGTQTARVNIEMHFYKAGTSAEVSVSGVFHFVDNDQTEGWKVISGSGSLYAQADNILTVDSDGYVVGTETTDSGVDADIYMVFTSSASSPIVFGYTTDYRLQSSIQSTGYSIEYEIVGTTPSDVIVPSTTYISRFINTTQAVSILFPTLTASGYSWNGWYTTNALSGSKYTGTASTQSNITVYGSFEKQYGNLKVTKESEDGDVSGVKFRLYGTSTTGTAVDVTATTNSSGVATFSNVLIGTYTLVEVDTASYYITPSSQTVTISADATATVTVENMLKHGNLKVTKETEDGVISGVKFRLYGISSSGESVDLTATTNSSGVATFSDVLIGTYSLAEVDTAPYYITPAVQTVTISYNTTATATVENILKRGNLKVTKTSEDGLVSGLKFRIYGTSDSGATVDITVTTDSAGVATFSDVLIGTYTLVEADTPAKYVIPDAQTVTITYNTTISAAMTNILKKFRVIVTKVDSETTSAQGDATLAGAVYGIYQDGELVDTYTTDKNGQFTTEYYICGDDWSIKEITPSEGYLLDETEYHVNAEAKNFTVEYNTVKNTVKEDVIKGTIAIVKHNDLGDTGVDTPEDGAVFQIYLTSSGSYDNAATTERATLTTDENGYAVTQDLPYGTYTVHQVSGWEGRYLIDDFNVYIASDGKVYRYLLNNGYFEGYLKIIKVDAETGETIPYAGAAFQLYDTTGNLITMKATYPSTGYVDTFYTSDEGYLLTPETLTYGINYSIVETQAPNGYVLDSTPVYFTMDDDYASGETVNDIDVVAVEVENMPQKGIITIYKTGEVFATVEQTDDFYQAIYETQGLSGATYEITAAEDIYTGDGTLRYSKGDVVDTITTGSDGKATSKELYLGAYNVQEIEAPYGMIINDEIHTVELTYAGQLVSVTEIFTSFVNDRQKASVSLDKVLEIDNGYGIGTNDEITDVAFALYAGEDLTATDGTIIPADGLIEIAYCDEDGSLTFDSDLPLGSYYVQEYATDKHYVLDDTQYAFTFDYAGQDVELVNIALNDGTAIENDIIRGSVSGLKLDEDGSLVEGALFGIFATDTTEFTEDTAIAVSVSDAEGVFGFDNVPYGEWVIREISAPDCYVVDDTLHYVTISSVEQVAEITVVNNFVIGSVQTTKTDAEYPDNKLTGATFVIYQDTDGDGDYVSGSDLLAGEMTEIEDGVYTMDDLRYGGYFLYEETAPEGYVRDTNYYYFEITEDGKTLELENDAGHGFVNQPITGTLELTKVDVADGTLLPNAGFRICDEDGNTVAEGYTDESGLATFTLHYGKYTYQEFDAPDGYQIDETPFAFEITEDRQIIKAQITNELIPYDTGDTDTTTPALAIALGSLSMFAGLWRIRHYVM